MDFQEFLKYYREQLNESPAHLRKGQILMNSLNEIKKEIYELITNEEKEYDCFYDDKKITNTLNFISSVWN